MCPGAEDTRRTFDMLWIGIDTGGMASTRSTFSKSSLVQGRHLLHTFSLPTLPRSPSLTPKCTLDKWEHFLLKGYGRDDLIATEMERLVLEASQPSGYHFGSTLDPFWLCRERGHEKVRPYPFSISLVTLETDDPPSFQGQTADRGGG
ncbi:MAG: hypothetical protein J3Q66DRAFT_367669 [Benniella sp.]|nr:MAG: hypothetical protein J3Q66DRAFT_367669 [Benniella sp.]